MLIEQRLIELRKKINSNASAFSRDLGIPQTTYVKYERGERKPSSELIEKLYQKYNANIHWLFTGEGEMFLPTPKSQKQLEIEQGFKERNSFGKRLNLYKYVNNLTDLDIAQIINSNETMAARLGIDDIEPNVSHLKALKNHSGISLDLWLCGEDNAAPASAMNTLSAEELKMLEFLKKAKENKLL